MPTNQRQRGPILPALLVGALAISGTLAASGQSPVLPTDSRQLAAEILQATGVQGGVIVNLGCREGELTADLRADERYIVHGLDTDPERVRVARSRIREAGKYGPVSVDRLAGSSLPYADNLVNLVVSDTPSAVPEAEILRVLVPGGVAYLQEGDTWRNLHKPRPDTIDEWTHFLHDAGNNAVARDSEVGPPRCLQWVAPPLWLRSHETPSGFQSLVSSAGRVFYFLDEGIIGITDQRLPERWALLCRDAFNGKLLWRRPLAAWGWPEWAFDKFAHTDWTDIRGGRTVVPVENQRRLVADGDRLYATLGYQAPLAILDAATGAPIAVVEQTGPVKEILASDGIVVATSRPDRPDAARRRGKAATGTALLTAVEGRTGKLLWQQETRPIPDLFVAADAGRVVYQDGTQMTCLDLATGTLLWRQDGLPAKGRNLIAYEGVIVLYAQNTVRAYDGRSGALLWQQEVPPSTGGESDDLFIVQGLVWRGMVPVDVNLKPVGKSANVLAIGLDLRTGEEKQRIHVQDLRSPEHHHRCYRNKATERFLISGMEGAEFLDLSGQQQHDQNNWLRGACKVGVVPCNGLLYVPADQCFCQPGAKLLGLTAVAAADPARDREVPDGARLEKGPAYGAIYTAETADAPHDWPAYRYDGQRHGASPTIVPKDLQVAWKTAIGGPITAPVAAGGRVYIAERDAHTVLALDARDGSRVWEFVAGGRIDSPPTCHAGWLLFGSADGYVYCLRASDGVLAWRFLAAPYDCRIGCFDQLESVWPVHGSVLVREGVAYATAGRSTYLDGGIRVYALDPRSGRLLHKACLEGPFPDIETARDVAFFVEGANSDVLVSEGDFLYMRQKKLTPELREVPCANLSNKGEKDVGLHVFSTAGLLDASGYNRTFWMYSKRWPGFQLANQAPKSGQLLVVDQQRTYAVNMFYRRNVHSPLFFPGNEGALLFADSNTNEPQIVGEEGARKAVEWLPQSHIPRDGNPGLDSPAFGLDKMIGYTRAEPPLWTRWLPIRINAMVKTAAVLFVAGAPDILDPQDPYASFEGRCGARLAAVSPEDGSVLAEISLDCVPVFDGLIAADGKLFVAAENGSLVCLAESK